MKPGHLVVVGASAGGVEALTGLVASLPEDLAAAVVVVLHIPRDAPSALAAILDRAGPLPAATARHGQRLESGTVHVAPSGRHTLVLDGVLQLSAGPKENGHRPAIDPLFRSAALAYGPAVIGIVLSGSRDDGASGLAAVVRHGGTAVVQDPDTALYRSMPEHALAQAPDAHVAHVAKMGSLLGELVRRPVATGGDRPPDLVDVETSVAATGRPSSVDISAAHPSPFSCPDCQGVLFEVPGGSTPRFRCRVGHAWSPASLDAAQTDAVDDALWAALRALEEKVDLLHHLAEGAADHGRRHSALRFRSRAAEAGRQAEAIRALVGDASTGTVEEPSDAETSPATP